MFANSIENFLILRNKLTLWIIISFMFIIALIIWYLFLTFLSIKNQKFLYKLKLNFKKSTSILSWNILMIINFKIFKIEKLKVC